MRKPSCLDLDMYANILFACLLSATTIFGCNLNAFAQSTSASTGPALSSRTKSVRSWFQKYDQIRTDAEMTPDERKRSKKLLCQALKVADPREEADSKQLAQTMVSKYAKAIKALKALQPVAETKELQNGYARYFTTARQLFLDCARTGSSPEKNIEALKSRKEALASLDRQNKSLDAELRKKYDIPPHKS